MPKRLKLLVEEQEIIRRLLPSAGDRVFNPDFVYFLVANLVRQLLEHVGIALKLSDSTSIQRTVTAATTYMATSNVSFVTRRKSIPTNRIPTEKMRPSS
jgi:hypothetical protein